MRLPRQGELRLTCLFLAPLALAACQGKEKPAETGTAQGEVLPGSVSDAMLPLDTVRSQPPLAPLTEAAGKSGQGTASGKASGKGALPDEDEDEDADATAAGTAAAAPPSPPAATAP